MKKIIKVSSAPRHDPELHAYRKLARAVLLLAVRDARLFDLPSSPLSFHNPTPTPRIFKARQFLTNIEECGGWCGVAGIDGRAFQERMSHAQDELKARHKARLVKARAKGVRMNTRMS